MVRRNIGSGYAFAESYGYSLAVRINDQVYVSGTTARGAALKGTAYEQTRAILGLVEAALADAGARLQDVVRTVVYITDLAAQDDVARAHLEAFSQVKPASTLV